MTPEEKRTKHADYMREYSKRPEEKIKKAARHRRHYQANRQKILDDCKTYRNAHIEETRLNKQQSYQANKTAINQRQHEYYLAHPEEFRARRSTYYIEHKEASLAQARAYSLTERGKAAKSARIQRRRAIAKKAEGSFTQQEWLNLKEAFGNQCLRCGNVEGCKLTVDHIIPLSEGGSNFIHNIQPLCGSCNAWKFTRVIDYRPKYG